MSQESKKSLSGNSAQVLLLLAPKRLELFIFVGIEEVEEKSTQRQSYWKDEANEFVLEKEMDCLAAFSLWNWKTSLSKAISEPEVDVKYFETLYGIPSDDS